MHGYDAPWPAGGGKNKLVYPYAYTTPQTINGVTFTPNADGTVTANGTATAAAVFTLHSSMNLPDGNYVFSGGFQGGIFVGLGYFETDDAPAGTRINDNGGGVNITTHQGRVTYVQCVISSGMTANNLVFKPMIRLATEADATFAPYSNECPISGWPGAEIYHEAEYDADASPKISVNWEDEAGTVYGGTLAINPDRTGTLVVDRVILTNITVLNKAESFSTAEKSVFRVMGTKLGNGVLAKNSDNEITTFISNRFRSSSIWNSVTGSAKETGIAASKTSNVCYITVPVEYGNTIQEFNSWLEANPTDIVCDLVTPITYQLTAEQVSGILTALDGINVIWANTGDVTVTYIAKSAKFSFGSPLHNYNYNNLKLFGNTYIEHGKG